MNIKVLVMSLGLTVMAVGCCLHRVDLDVFRQASLSGQINQYEAAMARDCVRLDHSLLLDAIAGHGLASVEAMIELLKHPDPNFPLWHAIVVIEFVHFKGTDLRGHEVLALLDQIAKSSADSFTRESAKRAAEDIRSNHVPSSPW